MALEVSGDITMHIQANGLLVFDFNKLLYYIKTHYYFVTYFFIDILLESVGKYLLD